MTSNNCHSLPFENTSNPKSFQAGWHENIKEGLHRISLASCLGPATSVFLGCQSWLHLFSPVSLPCLFSSLERQGPLLYQQIPKNSAFSSVFSSKEKKSKPGKISQLNHNRVFLCAHINQLSLGGRKKYCMYSSVLT